jgi:hypothetical protein
MMVVIAAPFIGRATSLPVWVNAADKLKPRVRLGNPKVEEYLGSGELRVYDQNAAPAKGERSGK